MVRGILEWKCILLHLILLNGLAKCLPLDFSTTTETQFSSNIVTVNTTQDEAKVTRTSDDNAPNITYSVGDALIRNLRPGQSVRQYGVFLTFEGNQFTGRAVIDVVITDASIEDSLLFHLEDVVVQNVLTGVYTEASALTAEFSLEDGILEVFPVQTAATFIVIVEYSGTLSNNGHGLYLGQANGNSYMAMNLYPTNARRVFPCIDEPTAASSISLSFNNVVHTNVITNAVLDENNSNEEVNQFQPLQNPPYLWGMVAHNFMNLNIPTEGVFLDGRPAAMHQDSQASLAINAYFEFLSEWTNKPYFEITLNQDSRMHVIALPDVDRNWNALSIIGLWEPYVLMETSASVKQRKTVLVKVAEAMSRQWFGYVIYPQNWKHEWIISGLATHSAYEAIGHFQAPAAIPDVSLLDVDAIFLTDVMQESLLQDAYTNAPVLEPEEEIFEEDEVRDHINGLLRYKAPAIMRMLSWVIGDQLNLVQLSARALLAGRALQTVSTQNFNDAVNSLLLIHGNEFVDDIAEFLEPWLHNNGYPLISVGLRQGGVLITQERFSFTSQTHINFDIPLSFTTSLSPNFDIDRPVQMITATTTLDIPLGDDDWVLFNIQGQGYYRVNYDDNLWERIIEALGDPDRRELIHPLNRATLIDDALNLARAGRLDYDIALRVVLTMEHETEYAVWKAFVRNMNFLRKRLVALVNENDDLDPDIYLRMVRRTVGSIEDQLGFQPDPLLTEPAMASLARGLVMDHACRSNYAPCIAAAVDLFYDPNDNEAVNPNIPYDIRPAVYCTMVKEGDANVIMALNVRLDTEASHYERVVILESFGCSQDDDFIRDLLDETLIQGNRFLMEERVRIFKAIAESSTENAWVAVNFMSRRTADIRNIITNRPIPIFHRYGGDQKVEELIMVLAENMASEGLASDFSVWVNAQSNNLLGSQELANRALQQVNENLAWDQEYMDYVYEWIDLNDARTLSVSLSLVVITLIINIINQ